MTPRSNRELLAGLDREQDRIHDENEWVREDANATALGKQILRDLEGVVPPNAVLALLPANADPLAPQDPSRSSLFADRLTELIQDALKLQGAIAKTEPAELGRDALGEAVCAGCRGSCCRSGGDHAYLTEETILGTMHAHPEWTPAEVREAYLKCLPAESIVDSCIYHSATGCGLPRELRSETCNRHLCGKLKNLQAKHGTSPVLGVFFDRGAWVRTALIDESGCRVLSESGEQ